VKFNQSLEGPRADGSPSWWKGDDDAAANALAFATSMGLDVSGALASAKAG
jgi:hypothetical protein